MNLLGYLTTAASTFGPLAWIFFIGQILGVGAGAYLYFMHTERNAARQTFMRQLGVALMVLGGVGVVLGALRLLNVPVLNQRLWFWIQFLVELGVAGYVFYYMRSVLPGLEKAAAGRSQKGAPRPPKAIPGDAAAATPRPVATTGRRDARRDRKRKSK
jgi:4-amino-4-deoxy-L-arabinose transferase-like glycosyltransferase